MAARSEALEDGAAAGPVVRAEELVARARAMTPMLRARARASERERRISDEVAAALKAAGFMRMLQPRRARGHEHPFRASYDVMRELGAGCASTAWVAGLAITHHWMLAGFPEAAHRDVWDADPDALIFGSYPPAGTAEPVPGGYRVSGRWSYASGCNCADWVFVGIPIPRADGEKPQPGLALLPRGVYAIHDDWHTVGLAATGSNTVVAENVFVPAHRTQTFAALLAGEGAGAAAYGGQFRQPLLSVIPWVLASAAIGALQGAIEVFEAETRGRTTRGAVVAGGKTVARFPHVQARLGEAKAALIAADELAWRVLDRAASNEAPSLDSRIEARLCQAFAVRLAQQGIDALYGAVGGAGLSEDAPVQRAWRDIHAVAKHISLNWDAVGAMAGQHALGLDPQGQF
jgi:alkylation response protein AidB-like acyl-CoA dehydrogenase